MNYKKKNLCEFCGKEITKGQSYQYRNGDYYHYHKSMRVTTCWTRTPFFTKQEHKKMMIFMNKENK